MGTASATSCYSCYSIEQSTFLLLANTRINDSCCSINAPYPNTYSTIHGIPLKQWILDSNTRFDRAGHQSSRQPAPFAAFDDVRLFTDTTATAYEQSVNDVRLVGNATTTSSTDTPKPTAATGNRRIPIVVCT